MSDYNKEYDYYSRNGVRYYPMDISLKHKLELLTECGKTMFGESCIDFPELFDSHCAGCKNKKLIESMEVGDE